MIQQEMFVYNVAVMVLTVAFVIMVLRKIGLCDWVQMRSPKLIANLLSCNLCLGFWLSVIFGIIAFIFTGHYSWFVAPVLSAPLIKKIL